MILNLADQKGRKHFSFPRIRGIQDASRGTIHLAIAPASWSAPALGRFGPGQRRTLFYGSTREAEWK